MLWVSPAASAAEIKAAYRALVKQHHPDAGGDHRTILELNAAWEVLRNSERRSRIEHTSGTTTTVKGLRSHASLQRPLRQRLLSRTCLLCSSSWLLRVIGSSLR